jgi:hypothetical protein
MKFELTLDFRTNGIVMKFLILIRNNTKFKSTQSYMLTNESLKENSSIGFFRSLETNKIVLPTTTHLRLLITAVDVRWTIPSFG